MSPLIPPEPTCMEHRVPGDCHFCKKEMNRETTYLFIGAGIIGFLALLTIIVTLVKFR